MASSILDTGRQQVHIVDENGNIVSDFAGTGGGSGVVTVDEIQQPVTVTATAPLLVTPSGFATSVTNAAATVGTTELFPAFQFCTRCTYSVTGTANAGPPFTLAIEGSIDATNFANLDTTGGFVNVSSLAAGQAALFYNQIPILASRIVVVSGSGNFSVSVIGLL